MAFDFYIQCIISRLKTSPEVMTTVGLFFNGIRWKAILAVVWFIELTIRLLVHRLLFQRTAGMCLIFIVVGIALSPWPVDRFAVLRAAQSDCVVLRVLGLSVAIDEEKFVGPRLNQIPEWHVCRIANGCWVLCITWPLVMVTKLFW